MWLDSWLKLFRSGPELRGEEQEEEGEAQTSYDQEGEVGDQERARVKEQVQVDADGSRGHQQVGGQGRYSVLSWYFTSDICSHIQTTQYKSFIG